tara:strand:+ start:420 stop:1478 length:1059 start_codon:yes stop_codon:yes gene_type:complete
MSDILSIQTPYEDQDTVTSTNLNDLVKKATFTSAAVDDATTQLASGAIIVRDGGITTNKLEQPKLNGVIQNIGTAYVGGLQNLGSSYGANSLTLSTTQVSSAYVASGESAVAVGNDVKADGLQSVASGYKATSSGQDSVAIGSSAGASGINCVAIGKTASALAQTGDGEKGNSVAMGSNVTAHAGCVAIGRSCSANGEALVGARSFAAGIGNTSGSSGDSENTAVGLLNTAGGGFASCFGYNTKVSYLYGTVIGANVRQQTGGKNVVELGKWNEFDSNKRDAALNMQETGQVAFTINNSDTIPTDGGATTGAEALGALSRGMYTIQKNTSDAVTLHFNDAGTIKSLLLGTVS